MRVAVIGCGSIGRRHIGNLLALECDVYAYDPSETARMRAQTDHPTARVFGLLGGDERYDAWVIATPYDQHLVFVEMAVAARMPFFVEKPLGSLDQLPDWRRIAGGDLPVNQVGYQCRFNAEARALRAAIPAPICGSFRVGCDMRTWPGGVYGPMLLELSHEIDLALWCGAPAQVDYASLSDTRAALRLGQWFVMMDGRTATYRRDWSLANAQEGYQIAISDPKELGEAMYRDELAHFLDCVRNQTPTAVPLADGLRVLEVCQQVEEATTENVGNVWA